MRTSKWLVSALVLALSVQVIACKGPADDAGPAEEGAAGSGTEAAPAESASVSKVPADSFVQVTAGEPETLDPAWSYETSGSAIESNIYDTLVYFKREKADEFAANLAEAYTVSDDGLTYTFTVREGVKFHAGGDFTASDMAYTMQRGLLQDRAEGPQWLFMEPLLGVSTIESMAFDLAGLDAAADPAPTMEQVPDDVKVKVCEAVQASVTADNAARTVTFTLKTPTPWFLQLISQPWGGALDQEWMVENGDWDGTCATWTKWHNPEKQNTAIFDKANGTGPYKLGEWKKGEQITLEGNEAYWRTEPIWEGGPSGPADLKHIVVQFVEEWGTRYAKLEAGEADAVVVPRANIDQVEKMIHTEYAGGDESAPSTVKNPDGALKLFLGYPSVSSDAATFIFDVNKDSTFLKSGKLDGEGVPPDFFSDIHVRKGFTACFDWDTYIAEGLKGEGVQSRGPIIAGLQGFKADSPVASFDAKTCEEELALAWDGKLPEMGFKMAIAYNQGNDARKTAAQILADNLAQVNTKYAVEVQELEWPSFLEQRRSGNLPITIAGWLEDYHDASNWVSPFMDPEAGAYARAQNFPADMQKKYKDQIVAAVNEVDPVKRDAMYADLQMWANDDAIAIWLAQATGRFYISKDVSGWYNHSLQPGLWYYTLSKE
ncbi:MAG TPA: ABC transporter substrate-binding protein [Anaerolineae bacterium]|nr:ABC transporter substrate-binding protein [Ardenticatenia bacterium]HQZ70703.1 ABC transporter substrate-binding protein [Anaerolineae bacterium]